MNIAVPIGKLGRALPQVRPGMGRGAVGFLLLAPVVLLLVVLFIYPLVGVVIRSLSDPEVGFKNYTDLYSSTAFRNVFKLTFEIAIYTTIACLVLAYPFAYKLSTLPKRWANICLILSLVPFWTAILARLYAWTWILGRRSGINDWLMQLGWIDEPLELGFNRTAVIIGMVHVMLPFMIIILYSTMLSIDRALLDASRSLGASGLQTFRRVFLPLTMPGVYAGLLLVFIISLGFYITPAVLGGGGDITISRYVQTNVQILRWGVSSAMSIVLLVVTVILFFIFNRFFSTERLITGALRK